MIDHGFIHLIFSSPCTCKAIILLDHLVLVKPCWLEQINDGVESGRDPVDKEQDKDTAKHVADGEVMLLM